MDLKTKLLDLLLRGVPPRVRRTFYRLGPLAQLARRILTPASQPSRLRDVTVSSGTLKGVRLQLDLSREKSLWLGTYEPDVERALIERVRPGDVCLDIGAHAGYFTLVLSRLVGERGRVIAFEPHPSNLDRLHRHLEMNGCTCIRIENIALSNRSGRASLHAKPGSDSREFHLGPARKGDGSVLVRVQALDRWLRGHPDLRPSLLKIDVEGAEGLVLAGAQATLRRDRPVIVCEVHGDAPGQATWKELKRAGYRIEAVEGRRALTRPPAGGHIVALPPAESIRARGGGSGALTWSSRLVRFPA